MRLKSSPVASVEPVKLSVQTPGLLLTPTLAGLVPVLGPALLRPPAHTCPASNMMMYFWVSTGAQSVDIRQGQGAAVSNGCDVSQASSYRM